MLDLMIMGMLVVIIFLERRDNKKMMKELDQVKDDLERGENLVGSLRGEIKLIRDRLESFEKRIPNLGTEFKLLERSLEDLRIDSSTFTRLTQDTMSSVELLLNAQEVLKGLSDQITCGDAQSLLSILLAYSQRVKVERKNESFHRHVNGLCKVLKEHVDEEVKHQVIKIKDSAKVRLKARETKAELPDDGQFL